MMAGSRRRKKLCRYLRMVRLPLVSATIAMSIMLLLDLLLLDISPPPSSSLSVPVALSSWDQLQRIAQADIQEEGLWVRKGKGEVVVVGKRGKEEEEKGGREEWRGKEEEEEEKLLFSQSAWDNVKNDEDWDSFFDSEAWSSLLNEGAVGVNVKDEAPLPRFKKTFVGGAGVPKDIAFKAKAPVLPVVTQRTVISLGRSKTPADLLTEAAKGVKVKDGGPGETIVKPAKIEKFPARATSHEPQTFEWFDTAYKRSPTYGKAKEFVEDEALFGSCGASIIAARNWAETLLALGPFRYMGRSKNPCWYPEDGVSPFMCMPHFYLAGAEGPGTEDVMRHLMIHPHVMGHAQPIGWWDVGRQAGKSWEWYCRQFQRMAEDIILDINEHKTSSKIFGDSSSSYFASPTGWERLSGNENCLEPRLTLASHLRRLRLKGMVMVVLPHPTRRLIAEIRNRFPGRRLNPQQLHGEVEGAVAVYKACFSQHTLRQCAYNRTLANSVKLSLHEGMYSVYMEDWVRIFPPEQFLVVRYEDFVNSTVTTLQTMFRFMAIPEIVPQELAMAVQGLSRTFNEVVNTHNPQGGAAGGGEGPGRPTAHVRLLPETLHLLNDFYQPFLVRLGQIMGDVSKFTWQDSN